MNNTYKIERYETETGTFLTEDVDKDLENTPNPDSYMRQELCPVCGGVGINEGSCFTCMTCGWSKCDI